MPPPRPLASRVRVSLFPEPLRIPAFRDFWLARLATTIAQMAMVIVIGWQVYDIARHTMGLKEAALRLGIIGVVQFVPLFLLTLVTGWTADRIDRRWIARASVALEFACALTLGLFCLDPHHHPRDPLCRGGVARRGARLRRPRAGSARAQPRARGRSCRAPSLCRRWPGRPARSSARRLGGYLYAYAPYAPYAASSALFGIAFLGLLAIPPIPRAELTHNKNPWAQMVEGLKYVRRNRLILGAISLDLFAVLLGGATAMLPVFARDVLHAGSEGLGHLRAAPAVGATLTAAYFSARPLKHNVGREDADRRGDFRSGDGRLRLFPLHAAVARVPCPARRGRHVLGLRAAIVDPALHAGRDAWPGRRGFVSLHLGLERVGGSRIRLPRRADRSRHRGHRRRSRRDRHRPALGVVVPGAAACKKLRRTRFAAQHTKEEPAS